MKNIKFKVLLTALSAVILLSVTSPVYGQNTLRKLPSVAKKSKKKTAKVKDLATDVRQVPADTVTAGIEKTVTVSGYEKPLRASKETVLVTNRDSVRALDELTLLIEYKTTDGRMLHKRTVTVYPLVEPGETRLVTFPTWDVNRLFYYHFNQPRTNSQATPYTVSITPVQGIMRKT